MKANTLAPELLRRLDAYWRAAYEHERSDQPAIASWNVASREAILKPGVVA